MNRSTRTLVLGMAALLALAAGVQAEPLVINGGNTVIVNCGDGYAAPYLQHYLMKYVARDPKADDYTLDARPRPQRDASTSFPLLSKSQWDKAGGEKIAILVGPLERIPADRLPAADRRKLQAAKRGSVLLSRQGRTIVLTKRDARPWDFNPIRLFLDQCAGVRMYAPAGADGLEWVSMPPKPEFTVDELAIFMQPVFAKTTFSSSGHKRNTEWNRMNTMVSEGLNLRASHTITRYFPPEKYHQQHPELYPMGKDGRRPRPQGGAWNPCFADPDLSARIAMQEIREMMKGDRPPGYLSFGVMDCRYDCQCPTCQQSMAAHNGDAANLWYAFLNRVARACQKEFPGLYLTNYAYSNINLPQGMRIEPNIVVDNVIKSYRYVDPQAREGMHKEILAFAELGASWITHDWNFQACTPRIYSRSLAKLLQWGARNGMKGIYTEWSGGEYWYLTGAHYWVLRQLLSDPSLDTDALWRQYCRDMYGAGAEPMVRFYQMFQRKHEEADQYCVRADWPRQEALCYTDADLAQQRRWLEQAIAATAADPMIQKRLAAVMRYFRAHEMLARAVGVPGRLYHQYTVLDEKTGVNDAALAFYVNDDGQKILEFDEYYDTQRTIPPDSNAQDQNSGIRFSYRNNYARALGTIIAAIKAQAVEGVALDSATRNTVETIIARTRRIFAEHLPAKYDARRAQEIQGLMEKFLWVPRGEALPTIDGDLSDDAWRGAATLDGFTIADVLLPTQLGNETSGKIMRVGDHLVIGVACRQPGGIWAATPPDVHTGARLWREAGCEFFFGPPVTPGQDQEFIQYIVNTHGAFQGFHKARDNRKDVHCAVRQADDGKAYTIEVALPLKVEGLYDYSQGRIYTFNIMRNPFTANTFNPKERIGWAPIFFTAGVPESRGTLIIE